MDALSNAIHRLAQDDPHYERDVAWEAVEGTATDLRTQADALEVLAVEMRELAESFEVVPEDRGTYETVSEIAGSFLRYVSQAAHLAQAGQQPLRELERQMNDFTSYLRNHQAFGT